MHYTEKKAGTSLPDPRPNVDAILSAIAHLQLAAEFLDAQTSVALLNHVPEAKRDRIIERMRETHGDIFNLYDRCCEYLFWIQCPQSIDA